MIHPGRVVGTWEAKNGESVFDLFGTVPAAPAGETGRMRKLQV
ncbi:hypothetical protein J2853_000109 [Streptosporangium lutulentum]|uniref:Uncharacterized protein n=1 Tax=Streptosporangium lutulentum TaxID=1461250 RepID=A0ABT9Q2E0_9ACTN|nr:hypothetical protein [Streptosporangium lutulentum]MDP9840898.1 hypothetical protein [Streptosporangium lutulentum]